MTTEFASDQDIVDHIPLDQWVKAYAHMSIGGLVYIISNPKIFGHITMAEAAMIRLSERGNAGIKTLAARLQTLCDSDLCDIVVLLGSADHYIDNNAAEEIRFEWDQRTPGSDNGSAVFWGGESL
jgi:hypothetical protein